MKNLNKFFHHALNNKALTYTAYTNKDKISRKGVLWDKMKEILTKYAKCGTTPGVWTRASTLRRLPTFKL